MASEIHKARWGWAALALAAATVANAQGAAPARPAREAKPPAGAASQPGEAREAKLLGVLLHVRSRGADFKHFCLSEAVCTSKRARSWFWCPSDIPGTFPRRPSSQHDSRGHPSPCPFIATIERAIAGSLV